MKRCLFSLSVVLAVCCALFVLILPGQAAAQGRYRGQKYTKADVDRIIKRVEERSDSFKDHVDRSLDRSRLDGTKLEDRLNEQVKELEKELDDLRGEFDRKDNWQETRENVLKVIKEADEINVLFRNNRLARSLEAQWVLVRRDLNRLAGIYKIRLLKA